MGWVKDTFLGGAEKKAAQQQVAAGKEAQAIQKQYYDDARKSIMDLMGPQYGNIMQAYQQAADVIGQGKMNSSDILKQAFSNSNQLIQSGNDAALSALLGRPSQMQLPQQPMPAQPIGLPSGGGLRAQVGGVPQSGQSWYDKRMNEGVPVISASGMPVTPGMDMEQRLYAGGQPMMLPGQAGIAINQPHQVGSVRTQITDPNTSPAMSQTAMQPTTMPSAPTIQQPGTSGIGLAASEQALQQGLQGQTNAYLTGLNQATGTLQNTLGNQLGALRQGAAGSAGAINQGLNNQIGAYQQGFGGAEQALNQYGAQAIGAANQGFGQARNDMLGTLGMVGSSIGQGVGALQAGENRALGRIDQYTGQAVNTLNPYAQTGQAALNQEAALSGALGGATQKQAINQFMESPAQQFLREQGEKAVLRQASATGGLRGGSTLAALQERGIGLAAQNQQQQLENLRSLAGRGQEASTNQAGFQQQAGTTGAGITAQLAGQQGQLYGQQANMQGQLGSQMAGMSQDQGLFGANVLNQIGQNVSGLRANQGQLAGSAYGNAGQDIASILSGLGQNESSAMGNTGSTIAQGQFGTGQNIGNAISNTGQALSGLRTQAGRDVANQMNSQTGQLSSNQLNLGNLLANLDTNTASQLAQLLTGSATTGANQQSNIATLLANLATGQGSNLANLQTQIGNAQGSGTVGSAAGMREGIGNVAGLLSSLFSDERLKENITKVSDGPIGIFAWTWKHIKEIPESLRGAVSVGVIAQEVQEKFPECVHSVDGWLKVDYLKLSQEVANA